MWRLETDTSVWGQEHPSLEMRGSWGDAAFKCSRSRYAGWGGRGVRRPERLTEMEGGGIGRRRQGSRAVRARGS